MEKPRKKSSPPSWLRAKYNGAPRQWPEENERIVENCVYNMEPMKHPKIVHLTSVHSPFDVRIFSKECCSLAQAGFQVTIVAPHSRDEIVDNVCIKAVPSANGNGRIRR